MKLTDIKEMAPPPESMRSQTFYHGVSKTEQAEFILKNGITPPDKPQGRNHMAPVAGRVYLSPSLDYAVIYALGANVIGTTMPESMISKDGPYGYLFVINGNNIQGDVQPDEDEVGRVLSYILQGDQPERDLVDEDQYEVLIRILADRQLTNAMLNMANRFLTQNQIKRIKNGMYAEWARSGKTLLKRMPDWIKTKLVQYGTHVAHRGQIWPTEMWRIDKHRSAELRSFRNEEGKEFFEVAEKVWEYPQQIQERVDVGQPKTGLLYRWVEPRKAVSNMQTNSLNPGKWKHNIPGVGTLAGISFGYNAKEWYDHNSSSEAICFVVDRSKLNPKKIIDIPGNEVFQYTIHAQNAQHPDMVRANKAIEDDINDPRTEPDEAFYVGIVKPLNAVLAKIIIPQSVTSSVRKHALAYAQKFNIPVSTPSRVRITESMPRTLYHGTTIDVARDPSVQRWGLEPRVGDFVSDAYELDSQEDVRDDYRPLVFAADKHDINHALGAVVHHVAKKLGKRSITPQEFLNHGALLVFKHGEHDFTYSDPDEYEDNRDIHPYQVEPRDYFSDRHQKPDFVLTGSKLKRVLERLGFWPYEHSMIEWPDEMYDKDQWPTPFHKRKAVKMAAESLTEDIQVATKFWFNLRTKKFESWNVRYSPTDFGSPQHDEALIADPQRFGLVPDENKDGAEFSSEAFKAGWVRGVISSVGDLYLECGTKKEAQATIRYLLSRKLVDRRHLDNIHMDIEKIGSVLLRSHGEVTQFLSEATVRRPNKFEQFLAAVEKIAPYDDEIEGHVSPAPRGYINFRESPYHGAVEIANIGAIDRGGGKNILGMICKLADIMKVKLSVHASPVGTRYRHEGDSESLFLFYEYFGFDSDGKRDEDWDFKGKHMIRLPNANPDHTAIEDSKLADYQSMNAQLQQWRKENLNEVHYQDLFPEKFETFHRKYRTLIRKGEINPNEYYVQFRNFAQDKLDRTAFEKPNHTDPMGVYAYPLKYVLEHPADIWYGAAARYLRVLKNTAKRPFNLKDMNEKGLDSLRNILWRLDIEASMKHLRKIKRHYQWSGKYAPIHTFMRALQINHEAEPELDGFENKRWPMRSAKEQTKLFLKAGYDAIIDQGTGAINQREPEQAVFLTRASFRVVDTFDLRPGQGEVQAMTINDPGNDIEFTRKFAQLVAVAIEDGLKGPAETSQLMGWRYYWTKKGRRIEISIERPHRFYQRPSGEKAHKYDRKATDHDIKVIVRSELGDIEYDAPNGNMRINEIANRIGERYRRLKRTEPKTSWVPQDRAMYLAQRERDRYQYVGNRMRREAGLPELTYDQMKALEAKGLNIYGVSFAKARLAAEKEKWKTISKALKAEGKPSLSFKQWQEKYPMVAEATDLPQQYSFHNDVTGHHHGQTDGTIYFYDRSTAGDDWPPRRVVGRLNWTLYKEKVFINYIEVAAEFQRRGIGTALVNELKKEFPDNPVVWSNTTPDGTALRKSMK